MVSVNVSARQLDEPTFVVIVSQILADTGLDPAILCLEVTETAVMSNPAGVQQAGRALRDLGVRLSIDDFGTGYASLTYLRRLHASELKIDRSFVDGLGHELDDTTIVTAVIALAHAMGLTVTAEGVETTEQLKILRDMGCQKAQGYLMYRPVPADALTAEIVEPERLRSVHAELVPRPDYPAPELASFPLQCQPPSLPGPGPGEHRPRPEHDRGEHAHGEPLRALTVPGRRVRDKAGAGGKRARLITADSTLPPVRMVLLTSSGRRGEAAQAREAGVAAYLTKPVPQSHLFDCLATVMGGAPNARPASGPAVTATRQIRRLQTDARRAPIVAVTTSAMKSDPQRCLAAGMDDYLPKPLSLEAPLAAMLDRWAPNVEPVGAGRATAASTPPAPPS